MSEYYLHLKHGHMLLAAVSILLFNLRYRFRFHHRGRALPPLLRRLPPINDTLLLASGLWMMRLIPWQPFGANAWLGTKFGLIVLYILFGLAAMKTRPRSPFSLLCYFFAMAAVCTIAYLARVKPMI